VPYAVAAAQCAAGKEEVEGCRCVRCCRSGARRSGRYARRPAQCASGVEGSRRPSCPCVSLCAHAYYVLVVAHGGSWCFHAALYVCGALICRGTTANGRQTRCRGAVSGCASTRRVRQPPLARPECSRVIGNVAAAWGRVHSTIRGVALWIAASAVVACCRCSYGMAAVEWYRCG